MSKARGAATTEPDKPRTSVSGVVLPEEQVSASHTVQLAEVPSRALDRLLTLGHDLPVAQGEDAVTQAFVEGVAPLLRGHAIAVVVGSGDRRKVFRADSGARESFAPPSREVEAGKMFANHLVERVVRIPDSDAVIYIAGDDAGLADDAAAPVQLAHRALFVLENARLRARMHEQLAALRAAVEERDSMLIQNNKLAALGQLAAGMVHEINNPLTSILAYTDFLAKRATAREDAEDAERLRRIGESAHRMLRLSRDIVSYARPSSSIAQPLVVSAVVEQALGFCEHLFEETGVAVERSFGDGVLPVRGHPEQLAQVFVNLFTNACHAMPEQGGRLTVTTELATDESRVRIVVADNGHGISASNLPRVFLPFFTTKTEKLGTGLGLAIVKRIIEAHEGHVEVDSSEKGTRFVIHLPAARET
jgi:two-component system NtrC family sensor kinase